LLVVLDMPKAISGDLFNLARWYVSSYGVVVLKVGWIVVVGGGGVCRS